jgi:amino acid permease
MPGQKLIITLMALVAVIIIGVAVYLFTRSSSLDMTTGIILVAIAVIGLLIILGVIFVLMRNLNRRQ